MFHVEHKIVLIHLLFSIIDKKIIHDFVLSTECSTWNNFIYLFHILLFHVEQIGDEITFTHLLYIKY